ncbi:lipase [Gluconobacter thailandicus NBRC 3257]|uniref:Lipase n=1 Tax=Gluconobacter thailandicus NBRC 3257 TaxID=1381097 RepID=A0ABQ0ISM2_GLUTH|nr:alpha/beta hydrolase [Gluconobacter thailandicus]KXV53353.1 lipase [Gluconobacter thailandicus]GAC88366.1 lipase [Gluconobacter thailandicus NBRC 3255]GAD25187.1 lipase [Gluconobacter thailandicus NBRC 3257]
MQPTFALRIFLFWLEWQARRRGIISRSVPVDVIPDIPAPMPSAAALAQIRRITGRPSFPQCLSSLRIRKWIEIKVPGEVGERPARLYRPRGKVTGVLLFLHGGGFVHCDTTSHHGICCRLAAASGAMVLSLDYRLAPEHRFPAGLRDAQVALKWLRKAVPNLPIAVAGDSAGGNLSAALTHWSRTNPEITLAAQLLYYPAVSGPIIPPSRQTYGQGYMLTTELLHWYCGQTLVSPDDLFDPEFSPVFAETFNDLPPAMIVTAGFDPLRGEGELYSRLLRDAGVPVRYRLFPRMIHGFLNGYALFRDGRTALREGGEFLREAFRKAGSRPS